MTEPIIIIVDRDNLPKYYPTHRHTSAFWEGLGRTIATFSFLEDILKKAIFALTATQAYSSELELLTAYEKWNSRLEMTLTDTLRKLSITYHSATLAHQEFSSESDKISELVRAIKEASQIRNVLCHGSWGFPDTSGKSKPFFARKDLKGSKEIEIFETEVDVEFLQQVQKHTSDLVCEVMNSITSKGWKFPGWNNPGKPIFD